MYGKEWEAHTSLKDGFARIDFADGTSLTVKNDGVTGYDFADRYLTQMEVDYPSHVLAADLKLQQRLGKSVYRAIKAVRTRYRSELALVSLNCCFGREDEIPDHEAGGAMHPEFVLCPERYHCPFNGFNPALKGKRLVCCNPIYECGLTPTQARLADLLVNTSLSLEEIADAMGCSLQNVKNIQGRIHAALEVNTRAELTVKLKGKRLV